MPSTPNFSWTTPADTDLVRDGAGAIRTLAGEIDTTVAGIASPNVVQTVKTDTFSASVAQGAISGDVTGLTVAITPSAVGSKVLVRAVLTVAINAQSLVYATLYRDGSPILRGDAASTRQRVSSAVEINSATKMQTIVMEFLDSPATVAEVVYSVRLSHQNSATSTIYVGRATTDSDDNYVARAAATITAQEIAA